jgi:hypothetical protein
MKNSQDILQALAKCVEAQKNDDPKLCPIYPEDESLTCLDCTCRDAFKWVLGEKVLEQDIIVFGESPVDILCTMPGNTKMQRILCKPL